MKNNKTISYEQALRNCDEYMEQQLGVNAFNMSEALAIVFNISKHESMDDFVKYRKAHKKT